QQHRKWHQPCMVSATTFFVFYTVYLTGVSSQSGGFSLFPGSVDDGGRFNGLAGRDKAGI
ncbi:hypothetical protein M5W75_23130, partial [Paenibacillus larvae]|uniref:hypothetical protein n=1 Tax=Paenibacillus larvae TaxID=1464 RepID=UPI002281983A